MLRLRPAFEGHRVVFATTQEDYRAEVPGAEFHRIPDGTRWNKIKLLKSAWGIFRLILKIKPDVIITTGAAPGYFAIRLGKLLRKNTVWIDSIANAEELSLSGKKAQEHATLWLTQWKHLAKPEGPHFYGNVLGDEVGATIRSGEPVESPSGPNQQPDASQDHASPDTSQDHASVISNRGSNPDTTFATRRRNPGSEEENTTDPRSPITDDRSSSTSEGSQITDSRSPIKSSAELKIFVTVGSDVPFDRLLVAVDEWAATTSKPVKIFAQIGNSDYQPAHFEYCKFLSPTEFKERLSGCDLVVAHTGMGSILSALRAQKPILTLPRHGSLGETRNDHQLATAKHLLELGIIHVAFQAEELKQMLDTVDFTDSDKTITQWASESLTGQLNQFINRS
nr:glycosyltransferase [Pelagicoccus enzymogenes]